MGSPDNRVYPVLELGIKMKVISSMTPEHPPHSLIFSAFTSIICIIISKYSHPIIAIGWFDSFLTYAVKVCAICASLVTILGFYFKYEKRIDKAWERMRIFFNRWF